LSWGSPKKHTDSVHVRWRLRLDGERCMRMTRASVAMSQTV
jgi:hypothetical protein